MGAIGQAEREGKISRSPYKDRYDEEFDRESAYEILKKRFEQVEFKEIPVEAKQKRRAPSSSSGRSRSRQNVGEAMKKVLRVVLAVK